MCELQVFLCSAHRRMHSGMCDVRCTKNLQLTFEMNGVHCTFFFLQRTSHIADWDVRCAMCAARKIMQFTLQFFKVSRVATQFFSQNSRTIQGHFKDFSAIFANFQGLFDTKFKDFKDT